MTQYMVYPGEEFILEKNVYSIVGYSILSMSVMYSRFLVLLQLVFELSKNNTILNVKSGHHWFCCFHQGLCICCSFGLEHSSHRQHMIFSFISVPFLHICHLIRKAFLDKLSNSNIFSVFFSLFIFYSKHLSLHIKYIYLSVFSTLLLLCHLVGTQKLLSRYVDMKVWKSRGLVYRQKFESHQHRGEI